MERLLGEHHDPLPESPTSPEEHIPGNEDSDIHFDPDAHSSMRAILFVAALSMHAVFEGVTIIFRSTSLIFFCLLGLSLGLLDQAPVLLQVFGALVIHKSVIGFSLGVRLVQSRLKNFTVIICCTVFAAQVLIGGFFGLGIIRFMNQSSKGTTHLVSGILQSVACGTFLYITRYILPHF